MTRPTSVAEAVDALLLATGTAPGAVPGDASASPEPDSAASAAAHLLRMAELYEDAQTELTDALVAAHDRLLAVYDLTSAQADSRDHAEAYGRTAAAILRSTDCDAGVLLGSGVRYTVGDSTHRSRLFGLCKAALRKGVTDAEIVADAPLPTMVAPVPRTIPALVVALSRSEGPAFDTGDVKLLGAVTSVIGGLVNLTRMHQREVERAQLEQEHKAASELAQAVLSAEPPHVTGTDVYARCVPAHLAGGDFFAFVPRPGTLWFAVGDVAGKGLPAAMIMTRAVTSIRNACASGDDSDPGAIVNRVNDELYEYLFSAGRFITMAVGRYRTGDGYIDICNAGHSPVARADGDGVTVIKPNTLPLGALQHAGAKSVRVPFSPGDLLVLGSDGLAEQQNRDGQLFGYDRFLDAVGRAHQSLSYGRRADDAPQQVAQRLFAEVALHAQGTQPDDDRTVVVLRATEMTS
ncbi:MULTISPECIES: PP2C family protein-serine/threonine phosphatase [Actinoplanes]|uniref:PP2C family protein-serine/threonine phosphatase n=1 Tax=Actinoplanes TaxID=1865 RepID=UPI0005F2E2BC|nr:MULTISPECIES: PP2C family protein-serine/threonine phosphatase [Actinoplanes]